MLYFFNNRCAMILLMLVRGEQMEKKIEKIISEMTLYEKAVMCSGYDTWRLKSNERLKIPEIAVSDGPHGLRKQEEQSDHLGLNDSVKSVCFPAACATAASFDIDLLKALGKLLGEECRAENISVLLGPAMNIKRNPLCGRNFEYFSEDPYLTGRLAAAQIEGIQKWNVGACPKHFAVNNQEFRRMTNSSEADEKTLREIYLSAFEYVVKNAKPWTIMCSYNKINGVFASENKLLLTDILRNDWGFDGFVMSDWGAVNNRVDALAAGLDLEMPYSGGLNDKSIIDAVKQNKIDEKIVDNAVERILKVIFKGSQNDDLKIRSYDKDLHHKKAVEFAKECAVLLKNNGILPLDKSKRIAYIGAYASNPRYQGGGSSHINAYRISSALESSDKKNQITYINIFDKNSKIDVEDAISKAKESDCAVVFAGLPDIYESEGYDRDTMRLPAEQNELISKLTDVQSNTVVVLHIGSPVEMPWIDKTAAVLCMYLAGEGVGEATNAILYGEANPSGRLPETFPLKLEDNPSYLTYGCDENRAVYSEGTFVGYRYYNAKNMSVLFPFGYGLSYTDFKYSDFRLSADSIRPGEAIAAELTVTNIGKKAGKEVVQFYVKNNTLKISPAELCGFDKIYLEAGESKTVSVKIEYRAFQKFYTEINDWHCEGGVFEIYAAKNSRDFCRKAFLNVQADGILPFNVDENTTVSALLKHPATSETMNALFKSFSSAVKADKQDEETRKIMREMVLNVPLRGLSNFGLINSEKLNDLIIHMNQLIKK